MSAEREAEELKEIKDLKEGMNRLPHETKSKIISYITDYNIQQHLVWSNDEYVSSLAKDSIRKVKSEERNEDMNYTDNMITVDDLTQMGAANIKFYDGIIFSCGLNHFRKMLTIPNINGNFVFEQEKQLGLLNQFLIPVLMYYGRMKGTVSFSCLKKDRYFSLSDLSNERYFVHGAYTTVICTPIKFYYPFSLGGISGIISQMYENVKCINENRLEFISARCLLSEIREVLNPK